MRFLILALFLCQTLFAQTHEQVISNLKKSTSSNPNESGWVYHVTPEQQRIEAEVVKFSTQRSFNGPLIPKPSEAPTPIYVQPKTQRQETTESLPTFMEVNQSLQGTTPRILGEY